MYYGFLRRHRDGAQIADALLALRQGLAQIPAKKPDSLLLATWNIREFGGSKYKGRTDEALCCIAEILNRFDIIAVQEVKADLGALQRIMTLLGRDWDRIFTDISYAKSGNQERLAYIWDRRKVRFTGMAGELVLPPLESKHLSQIARTPFICGFQAGWAKVNLCTVHIYYGEGTPNDARRVDEIKQIGRLLAGKAKDYIRLGNKARDYLPENLVLLGDFNIFKKSDKTFAALRDSGFVLPKALMKDEMVGSNVKKDKFYDQIAFYRDVVEMENSAAGIFDFFEHAFTEQDAQRFMAAHGLADKAKFRDWRTYQLSDHLVMWAEFKVDKTEQYLRHLAQDQA